MRYDKILIDLDDTLLDFHTANRRAVAALTEELNLASDTVFDEYQAVNHACWAALERGEMDQETLHVERFRRFLASKNRADDPARTADRFAELLGRQSMEIPGAYEMLRAIAARRPVVFLSNGITAIQRARLSRSRLTEFAAKVVISQEAGVSKPDPRIFEIALDGTAPERALMIGDGIKSDVLGANRAGVDVCWFNPAGKALPEGLHAEYEVRALADCSPIALQSLA